MAVERRVEMEIGAKEAGDLRSTWNSMGGQLVAIKNLAANLVTSFVAVGRVIQESVIAAFNTLKGIFFEITAVSSSLEETQSKFNAVFEDQAEAMSMWAEEYRMAIGRGRTETLGFLASVQDLFVPLGFTAEKAFELSKQVTELAFDIASFQEKVDADVMRALQSALVGNSEAVRGYGIILGQAEIQQELLNMGLTKGIKEATTQEKVMARLNIIMASTKKAQADARDTSGSWANTMKALTAIWDDFKASLGDFITQSPAVAGIVKRLRSGIDVMLNVLERWGPIITDGINVAVTIAIQLFDQLVEFGKELLEDAGGIEGIWESIVVTIKLLLPIVKAFLFVVGAALKTLAAIVGAITSISRGLNSKVLPSMAELSDALFDINLATKAWKEDTEKTDEAIKAVVEKEEKVLKVAKEINKEAEKLRKQEEARSKRLAEQFGFMDAQSRLQVRLIAQGLQRGGESFFQTLNKEQLALVKRIEALKSIALPFAQRTVERELGGLALTTTTGRPTVTTQIRVQVEAKLDVGGPALAQQMAEKVIPPINKAVAQAVNRTLDATEQARGEELAREAASFGK